MGLKLIEQMAEAVRYVEALEAKVAATEATCEDLSRIVACLVRVHGGMIPAGVWDEVHQRKGFVSYSARVDVDGVQIHVGEPDA